MTRIYTSQNVDENGLVALTLRRITGKNDDGSDQFEDDVYKVPPITDLDADLAADLLELSPQFWMAKFLKRHAPDLAAKLKLSQMPTVFSEYVNDPEVTPGE